MRREFYARWHRVPKGGRIVAMVVAGLVTVAVCGLVFGFFVKYLWNWLMPDLFGLKQVTYWQAFGLVVLFHMVFGSMGPGRGPVMHKPPRGPRPPRCPEEGEEMRGEWRHWKYYDEWWRQEGRKAFDDYVDKKAASPEPPKEDEAQ